MPDFQVQPGETVLLDRVEGELTVGKRARIKARNGKIVVVTGGAYFDGSAKIYCSFECESMRARGRGYGFGANIVVSGDLTVHGGIDVDASLKVDETLNADDVDVGGHLKCKSVVSRDVRVGGHMVTSGSLEAKSVAVGGHLAVPGSVKLSNLHVGGHAKVGGGVISGDIRIRGHFTVGSKLEFGDLKTFGHVRLPPKSKGEKLLAFGGTEFLGDAFCRITQVKGTVKVAGDYAAESIEIDGKLEVMGSLNVAKGLEVYGTAKVKRRVECGTIVVTGKLIADSAHVKGQADLEGEVKVARALKGGSIRVRKGSKVAGPLVGEEIEIGRTTSSHGLRWGGNMIRIGRMTDVQDIHGGVVRIGSYSRAKRVLAEVIEMDEGSIADQVVYTKDIKLPANYHLNKPPRKVSALPEFPT